MITCDIIIPIWDQPALTRRCIEALRVKTRTPYRLILVDNGSGEETRRYLETLGSAGGGDVVLLRNPENLGYLRAVNQGLKASGSSEFVCLMNNDIAVTEGWLEHMIAFARSRDDAGLVTCLQNNDPGRPAPPDLESWARSQVQSPGRWMELDHCTGGCLLIKREVIERVGFLDEAYGHGYWEDNDYSRRAQKAGFCCFRVMDTCVWHDVGASFRRTPGRKEKEAENQALFYSRWGKPLRVIYPVNEGIDFRRARFQQIFQTVHALARRGCEVDLLVGRNSIQASWQALAHYGLWPHENLRIHSLPMLRREEGRALRVSWDAVFRWACRLKIRELLRQRAYDAFLVRHLSPASFLLAHKEIFALPLIFEAHEIFFLTTERKEKAEKIRKQENGIYPRVEGIISISRGLAEKMKEVFPPLGPIEVIPDGVNPDLFRIPPQPADQRIVYAGQLYPWKGTGTLVEAMVHLPEGELHLVGGEGEKISQLREKARRLGVEGRIMFHGQVSPLEVRTHLSRAAVAVLPLTNDLISACFTSPLKLFEYMAAGIPIVASDLPSVREILTGGEDALLVPPADPAALAQAIRRIFREPGLGERLAVQARRKAAQYTWDRRAERLMQFIRSLPGKKGTP